MHYLEIAELGYPSNVLNSVWPPLYPVLIRALSLFVAPPFLAALIVSTLFAFLAFFLLYILLSDAFTESIARNSLFLLAVFPSAFFLVAGYTESTFMTLALGSMIAARRQRLPLAGLLGLAATLTRLQGVILVAPLLWHALQKPRGRHDPPLIRVAFTLAPAFLPIGGAFLFALSIRYLLAAPWPWDTLSSAWHQHTGWPWEGIVGNLTALAGRSISTPATPVGIAYDLLLAIIFLAVLLAAARRIPRDLMLYAALVLLTSLVKVGDDHLLVSFSRYALQAFPVFAILASHANYPARRLFIFAVGTASQALLLTLFYLWSWVA